MVMVVSNSPVYCTVHVGRRLGGLNCVCVHTVLDSGAGHCCDRISAEELHEIRRVCRSRSDTDTQQTKHDCEMPKNTAGAIDND